MKNKNIEVEGGELILRSAEGHYAIIPAKHRLEVQGMIDDGCEDCLNNYIQTLPKEKDYAEDGTLIIDGESPKDPPPRELDTPGAPPTSVVNYQVINTESKNTANIKINRQNLGILLNPMNWGVTDYTASGNFSQAFKNAKQDGKDEFIWNNKRYNTRKDTDPLPIKNTSQYVVNTKEYADYLNANYPEFIKLINRGSGINEILFQGENKYENDRAYYNPRSNSIGVGESPSKTDFVSRLIEETGHLKDANLTKN